jgi:hypothetical protein
LADLQLQVGFEDAAPGPFRPEAVAAGATAVSKSLVLKIANGAPSTFNRVVTITMPYDRQAANGLPPAVLFWDPESKSYTATSVIAVDPQAGLVTFRTSHFSTFVAVVLLSFKDKIGNVDTGFRMGADSILHPNFTTYQYGGLCAAFSSLSSHYFSRPHLTNLYALAQEGTKEQPTDDEITRSALTLTYALISERWASVANELVVPKASETGLLIAMSMFLTAKPIHIVLHNGSDSGHSITAYAYDIQNKQFKIYDSNAPKDEVTFQWDLAKGFGAYSRAAGYKSDLFNHIGFATDDTFGAPAQFKKIVDDWEAGNLKDVYANLSIVDHLGATQRLEWAKSVTTQVKYEAGQTVTGAFSAPGGLTAPLYLHVYRNGIKDSAAGLLLAADGRFTLTFADKLEQKVEVMLLVSQEQRDAFNKFSGFGKFTVQPESKNFFSNLGFEKGNTEGWFVQTRLLNGVGTPRPLPPTPEVLITNPGFDPLVPTLPSVLFGAHALRINDIQNGLHESIVSQKATVPLTGSHELRFNWAAVLEDPAHEPKDQPYLDVVVRNLTRKTELYRKRFYATDPSFPGWVGTNYKSIPWQTVLVSDLSKAAGDEIELAIVGADCLLSGHGGYVYLDAPE